MQKMICNKCENPNKHAAQITAPSPVAVQRTRPPVSGLGAHFFFFFGGSPPPPSFSTMAERIFVVQKSWSDVSPTLATRKTTYAKVEWTGG